MPPVAAQKLVADLRAFCDESDTPNKQIAEKLGLSPSGLSDVLSGKNQLTASQQLLVENLLKPRTLSVALDRIKELEAKLGARAGTSITSTAPIVSPLAKSPSVFVHGGSKAIRANAGRPTGVQMNEENDGWAHDKVHKPNPNAVPMPVSGPPMRKLRLPESCVSPWLAQEVLKKTSLEDCRLMLMSETDPSRKDWIYQEIVKRRQS